MRWLAACGPSGVDTRQLGHGQDDGPHQVDGVVRGHALQDSRDALEPHAGIDGGPGQGDPVAGSDLVELHEDEVPELQEPVSVLLGTPRRATVDGVALVVEDLRARAAGSRVAGGPEIVRGGDPDDAAVGQPGHLLPQVVGFVVVVIDRDEQSLLVEPEVPRDERPGILDRGRLEVIPERKIAEHLEERVMTRRVADVVEVVVLASGAEALLGRGGAAIGSFLDAGEKVFELHHSGAGEHERRIVAGDERPRRHDLVPRLSKEVEESRRGSR